MRRISYTALAVAACLAIFVSPAAGIVDGQQDSANAFPNVGSIEMEFSAFGSPGWFQVCTGTLIRPDVVLTAAHCMDFVIAPDGLGIENVRLAFASDPSATTTRYAAIAAVVHPAWLANEPLRGNSKSLGLGPGAEDIALVWLDRPVVGVAPAQIVAPGALDALNLKRETFTAVGYGLQGFVRGSILSARPVALDNGLRNYKDVSVVTEREAFADRYVKITASTCFGDSGGPLFHKASGKVAAINTWTSSMRCDAPSFSYRLDAPLAQQFLAEHLD